MPQVENFIQRFAQAGILDPSALTNDDRQVIAQLTEEEVTVLIQVATRLYSDDRGMMRLGSLSPKKGPRICVPL